MTTGSLMLADRIDAASVLALSHGTLHRTDTALILVPDRSMGMDFAVRIAAATLSLKDASDVRQQTSSVGPAVACKLKEFNPFIEPFETGLFVEDLHEFRLLLNKFSLVDRHVLVVTRQFVPQNTPIDEAMFNVVIKVMNELHGLAFFNHGEHSGASQPHKHVQVIPLQVCAVDRPDLPLAEYIRTKHRDAAMECIFSSPSLPFLHRMACLGPAISPARVEELYQEMLHQMDLESSSASYNFLMSPEFLMVIPRSTKMFQGIGVNSLGFAGCLFLRTKTQLETIERLGGIGALLSQLGFPPDNGRLNNE